MNRFAACSFALTTLLLVASASAADYYVSPPPLGDDNNSGAQAEPFATIQAAADIVSPGDTVHVTAGTFEGFGVDRAGSQGSPIRFVAEGDVLVDSPGSAQIGNTNDNIRLWKADYVIVEGFEVTTAPRAGISVRGDSGEPIVGAEVRGCTSYDNGVWGIFTAFAEDVVLESNTCSGSIDEHGIYHSNSGDNPVIRGNVLYSNNANGIHMNGDASMGGDGMISGALVEGNIIYDNGQNGGSGINGDGVSDSLIRNNLLYGNHASGISLYRIDAASGSTDNVVVHNTIVQASDGRWAINIANGSTGTVVFNNILYHDHNFRGSISIDASSASGFTSDYNVVVDRFSDDQGNTNMDLAAWQALGHDQNSLVATPSELFVDDGASNYHLADGCPAVDAGAAELGGESAPNRDLEGVLRPQGPAHDLGCYEWCPAEGCEGGDPDAGTGGSGTGGSGTGASGTGGSGTGGSGTGGSGTGGSDTGGAAVVPEDDSGCGCRTALGSAGTGALAALLGLAGGFMLLSRRRRRR